LPVYHQPIGRASAAAALLLLRTHIRAFSVAARVGDGGVDSLGVEAGQRA